MNQYSADFNVNKLPKLLAEVEKEKLQEDVPTLSKSLAKRLKTSQIAQQTQDKQKQIQKKADDLKKIERQRQIEKQGKIKE